MLHDYEESDRTCRYCGYTFESMAERADHESEIFRISIISDTTPEEVDN